MSNINKNIFRPWSDLPPELLTVISQNLKTPICILRFRSICRTWRDSCSPLPSQTAKNILSSLFPRAVNGKFSHDFFISNSIFLIQPKISTSPKCWIVFIDEFLPGRLCLRFPLSRYRVDTHYPVNFSGKFLNLLDFRVTQIVNSVSYNIRCSWRLDSFDYWNRDVDRLVLFPERNVVLGEFKAAVVRRNGEFVVYDSSLSGCDKWLRMGLRADDVVDYKGKMYVFDRKRKCFAVDYDTLEVVQVADVLFVAAPKRKRLVVGNKGLYVVVMDYRKDDVVYLRAYKLDEMARRWIEVGSLDDQVFFVGSDCSFSFSAEHNPGFQGNCIYAFRNSFLHGCETDYALRRPYPSMLGIFNLGVGGSFGPLDTCDMLWPPPSWVEPSSSKPGSSRMNRGKSLKDISQAGDMESKAIADNNDPANEVAMKMEVALTNDDLQYVARFDEQVTNVASDNQDAVAGSNIASCHNNDFPSRTRLTKAMASGNDCLQYAGVCGLQLDKNSGDEDLKEERDCHKRKATGKHEMEIVVGTGRLKASDGDFINLYPSSTTGKGKAIACPIVTKRDPFVDVSFTDYVRSVANPISNKNMVNSFGLAQPEPTVEQCIDILMNLPGISPRTSIFNYSCNLLCKQEMRIVFMNLSTDELRKSWLEYNHSLFWGRYPVFKQ